MRQQEIRSNQDLQHSRSTQLQHAALMFPSPSQTHAQTQLHTQKRTDSYTHKSVYTAQWTYGCVVVQRVRAVDRGKIGVRHQALLWLPVRHVGPGLNHDQTVARAHGYHVRMRRYFVGLRSCARQLRANILVIVERVFLQW